MSIKNWPSEGLWITKFSEIAYSDNSGQTWTKSGVTWGATSNFAQVCYVKNGGYVYVFGTQSGRFGNVYLARVADASLLTKSSYQYWDGNTWQTNNEGAAKPIVAAPAGEMSIAYNSNFSRWILTYYNERRTSIVMRDAANLTGPWTGEKIILTSVSSNSRPYGAYIHPWTNTGTDLYFNMTEWVPYNSFLMKTTINTDSLGENILSDPGYEDQISGTLANPWKLSGNAGVDYHNGLNHSGLNNAWVRNISGWNQVYQTIAVSPNTNYTLSGWIRTHSANNNGYFGVRQTSGTVINESSFGYYSAYTKVTVNFNSGANSLVEVYGGIHGDASDPWAQFDDVSVVNGEAPLTGNDEFNSSTLNSQWTWIRPDSSKWSLTASSGNMRITSQPGDIYQNNVDAKNMLITSNSQPGDWTLVTKVTGKPSANRHNVGLLVYANDDNYLKMVRNYNNGNKFEFGKEAGGAYSSGQATDSIISATAYLKIVKSGNNYTGYFSSDGVSYNQCGFIQNIGLSTIKVGLVSFNGPAGNSIGLNADFDYIHITP